MPIWLILPAILTALVVFAIINDRRRLTRMRTSFGYQDKRVWHEALVAAAIASFFTIGLPALSVWLALNVDR